MEPPPPSPPRTSPSPPKQEKGSGYSEILPDAIDQKNIQLELQLRMDEHNKLEPYNADNLRDEAADAVAKQEAFQERPAWSVKDTLRSVGNGGSNFAKQLYDFGASASGGKVTSARDLGWKQDPLGESTTIAGPFISGFTQFMIPFGTLGRANKWRSVAMQNRALKGGAEKHYFAKGVGRSVRKWTGVLSEGAALGGFADFMAWDPREPNLFNLALETSRKNNWEAVMPGFENLIEEWFAQAKAGDFERDLTLYEQFAGRLKNVGEGILVGAAVNAMVHGFSRNTKAWTLWRKGKALDENRAKLAELNKTENLTKKQKERTSLTKQVRYMEAELIQLEDTFLGKGHMTKNLRNKFEAEQDGWQVTREEGSPLEGGEELNLMPNLKEGEKIKTTSSDMLTTSKKSITNLKARIRNGSKKLKNLGTGTKNKAARDTLKAKLAKERADLKISEAAHGKIKSSQKVPEELKHHGGPTINTKFSESVDARDRGTLVASDTTRILIDAEAVRLDFERDGMSQFFGTRTDPISGKVYTRSIQEKTVLEAMNLDPVLLRGQFQKLGGAEAYAKFLELRQHHTLKLLKEGRFNLKDLDPRNPNHLALLSKANYDALTLSNAKGGLNINPVHLADGASEGLLRVPLPVDYESTLKRILRKDRHGDPIGLREAEEAFKKAREGKIDPAKLHEALKGSININELGTDSSAALVALTNLYSDLVSKGTKPEKRSEVLARSMGWRAGKKTDPRSAKQFLAETYTDSLDDIADSLGVSKEELEAKLKSGEAPYSKALKTIPEDIPVKDLEEGQLQNLHYRILAMRLRATKRMQTAQELSVALAGKYAQGKTKLGAGSQYNAWDGDVRAQKLEELEVAKAIYSLQLDVSTLRSARTSWGKQGLAFQNLDKLLAMKDASGASILEDAESMKILNNFIEGLGGSEKIAQLVDVIDVASRMPTNGAKDELARSFEVSRVVDTAVTAGFVEMTNEVWINAMLSGLRTHSVNNLSNGLKTIVTLGQQYAGSFMPDILGRGSAKALLKKNKGQAESPRTVIDLDPNAVNLHRTVDAGTEAAFQRVAAIRQFAYTFAFMKDVLRMYANNTPDNSVIIKGSGSSNNRSLGEEGLAYDRQLAAKQSIETTSEKELSDPNALLKSSNYSELSGGANHAAPLSANNFGQRVSEGADFLIGSSGKNAVNSLRETAAMGYIAEMWDGFYNSVIRLPIRKMVASDNAWKAAHNHGKAVGTLAAYGETVLGIKDPDVLAQFVLAHKDGIVRRNGELFSMENLELEFQAKAQKENIPASERADAKKEYIRQHYDLVDANGDMMMAGRVREELAKQSESDSLDFTFQRDIDQVSEDLAKQDPELRGETTKHVHTQSTAHALSEIARGNPFMKMFFPFVKVMANIFQDLGDNLPIIQNFRNRHKLDFHSPDPAKRARAKGRMVTAGVLATSGWILSQQEFITGRGPVDPRKQAVWRKSGKHPYSVDFGHGVFLEYTRLEPYGLPLRMMADAQNTWRFMRTPEEQAEWYEAMGGVMISVLAGITENTTYTQNLGELIGLINEAARSSDEGDALAAKGKLMRWAESRQASMVPNILEGYGGSIDEFQRELRTAESTWKAKTHPFGFPVKRDPLFGYIEEKHHYYPFPFIHAITPIKSRKFRETSLVYQEMASHFGALSFLNHRMGHNGVVDSTKFRSEVPTKLKPTGTSKEAKEKDEMTRRIWDAARKAKTVAINNDDYSTEAVACPVFPFQDAFDYRQQYISVRKEHYNEKDYQVWERILETDDFFKADTHAARRAKVWLNSTKVNLAERGAVTMEEGLLIMMQSKGFKDIPIHQRHSKSLNEKNLRMTVMMEYVNRCRARADDEMLGTLKDREAELYKKDSLKFPLPSVDTSKKFTDPDAHDDQFDDLYYDGPIGKHFPNLAWTLARIEAQKIQQKRGKLEDQEIIKDRISDAVDKQEMGK
jgi:hypothetical protein